MDNCRCFWVNSLLINLLKGQNLSFVCSLFHSRLFGWHICRLLFLIGKSVQRTEFIFCLFYFQSTIQLLYFTGKYVQRTEFIFCLLYFHSEWFGWHIYRLLFLIGKPVKMTEFIFCLLYFYFELFGLKSVKRTEFPLHSMFR